MSPHGYPPIQPAALAPEHLQLLEKVECAGNPADLVESLTEIARAFGVVAVDYGYVRGGRRQVGWSTNAPKLRESYFSRSLHEIDPEYQPETRLIHPCAMALADAYPDVVARSPDLGGLFEELRAQDRHAMIFVPDMSPVGQEEMATFNMMTDAKGAAAQRWAAQDAPALAVIAQVLHLKMRKLRRQQAANVLSQREIDVLQGFAEGKRAARLASDLGISERTVEHYARTARDRLGAKTRDQAVAIMVARGLIRVE